MKLCLDSDVAIELIRGGRPHYRLRLQEAQEAGASLHLSSISFHELMAGAMSSERPEHHMRLVARFAAETEVSVWSADDAMEAARLRADLRKFGAAIDGFDALIAGQALNAGWTLVTGNVREFIPVRGLPLLYWGDPTGPLDRDALLHRAGMKEWVRRR
jgi:tRNA(fMet)-specific endonuclease VapC